MELSCRGMSLPAETRMGPVHLTVSDLERSLEYYRRVVGLDLLEQGAGRASLGADSTELLGLVEEPGAQPSDGYTGLYHFALLVPDRPAPARWLAHAARARAPPTGPSGPSGGLGGPSTRDGRPAERRGARRSRAPRRRRRSGAGSDRDGRPRPRPLRQRRPPDGDERAGERPDAVGDPGVADHVGLDREREDRGEGRRQRGSEDGAAPCRDDERGEEREAPRDPEHAPDEAGLGRDLGVVGLPRLERHVRPRRRLADV